MQTTHAKILWVIAIVLFKASDTHTM